MQYFKLSASKIASIVFLLSTIFIALLLSGVTFLISHHPASHRFQSTEPFSASTKTDPQYVAPSFEIVTDKLTASKPIAPFPAVKKPEITTKVFDQIFGMNSSKEVFRPLSNF
jgi:hypothetical protein